MRSESRPLPLWIAERRATSWVPAFALRSAAREPWALCDRVMVISSGKILSDGGLGDLRRRISNERRLVVELVDENADVVDPDARVTERFGRRVALSFDPESVSAAELIVRVAAAHPVRDLFVENPPIEEILASIYDRAKP